MGEITKEKFELAKFKASLISGGTYKDIRDLQLKKILELSKSDIEPLELKGMLKLIASTDNWAKEFEDIQKERLQNKE